MKYLFTLACIAVIASLCLPACNKELEDTSGASLLLIKSSWAIDSIITQKISDPSQDSVLSKSCTTGDSIEFLINGSYRFIDDGDKCDTTVFPYSKGNWDYDVYEDSIRLSSLLPSTYYLSWKVLLLNDSMLKVRYTDSMLSEKVTKTILFRR